MAKTRKLSPAAVHYALARIGGFGSAYGGSTKNSLAPDVHTYQTPLRGLESTSPQLQQWSRAPSGAGQIGKITSKKKSSASSGLWDALGSIMSVFDVGRAAVTSTVKETGQAFAGQGASASDWWEQIVDPSKRVMGGEFVKAAGIENPALQFGLGLGVDVALDPLTYIGGAGLVHGAESAAEHVAFQGAKQLEELTGRGVTEAMIQAGEKVGKGVEEVKADRLVRIMKGVAREKTLDPAVAEQASKLVQDTAEAVQTARKYGVSGLSPDQLRRFSGTTPAGKQMLQKGLSLKLPGGLVEIPLTRGEGALSEISKGRYAAKQKVGDYLFGIGGRVDPNENMLKQLFSGEITASDAAGFKPATEPASRAASFGFKPGTRASKQFVSPEIWAAARHSDDPVDQLEATLIKGVRRKQLPRGEAYTHNLAKEFNKQIGHASDEHLELARDVIGSVDPTTGELDSFGHAALAKLKSEGQGDLPQKLSDVFEADAKARVAAGAADPSRLIKKGQYFPAPIDTDIREGMIAAGAHPVSETGTRARSVMENRRTLYNPETGMAGIGQNLEDEAGNVISRRHEWEVGSRAEAERTAPAEFKKMLEETEAGRAWLEQNPDMVKGDEVPFFKSPRKALSVYSQQSGRRIAQAEAADQLYRYGIGRLGFKAEDSVFYGKGTANDLGLSMDEIAHARMQQTWDRAVAEGELKTSKAATQTAKRRWKALQDAERMLEPGSGATPAQLRGLLKRLWPFEGELKLAGYTDDDVRAMLHELARVPTPQQRLAENLGTLTSVTQGVDPNAQVGQVLGLSPEAPVGPSAAPPPELVPAGAPPGGARAALTQAGILTAGEASSPELLANVLQGTPLGDTDRLIQMARDVLPERAQATLADAAERIDAAKAALANTGVGSEGEIRAAAKDLGIVAEGESVADPLAETFKGRKGQTVGGTYKSGADLRAAVRDYVAEAEKNIESARVELAVRMEGSAREAQHAAATKVATHDELVARGENPDFMPTVHEVNTTHTDQLRVALERDHLKINGKQLTTQKQINIVNDTIARHNRTIAELTATAVPPAPTAPSLPMNFSYGKDARAGIRSKDTFEAIVKGERTSTTRFGKYADQLVEQYKPGDIVEVVAKDGRKATVRVTDVQRIDPAARASYLDELSRTEGWSKEYLDNALATKGRSGAAVMKYEHVPPGSLVEQDRAAFIKNMDEIRARFDQTGKWLDSKGKPIRKAQTDRAAQLVDDALGAGSVNKKGWAKLSTKDRLDRIEDALYPIKPEDANKFSRERLADLEVERHKANEMIDLQRQANQADEAGKRAEAELRGEWGTPAEMDQFAQLDPGAKGIDYETALGQGDDVPLGVTPSEEQLRQAYKDIFPADAANVDAWSSQELRAEINKKGMRNYEQVQNLLDRADELARGVREVEQVGDDAFITAQKARIAEMDAEITRLQGELADAQSNAPAIRKRINDPQERLRVARKQKMDAEADLAKLTKVRDDAKQAYVASAEIDKKAQRIIDGGGDIEQLRALHAQEGDILPGGDVFPPLPGNAGPAVGRIESSRIPRPGSAMEAAWGRADEATREAYREMGLAESQTYGVERWKERKARFGEKGFEPKLEVQALETNKDAILNSWRTLAGEGPTIDASQQAMRDYQATLKKLGVDQGDAATASALKVDSMIDVAGMREAHPEATNAIDEALHKMRVAQRDADFKIGQEVKTSDRVNAPENVGMIVGGPHEDGTYTVTWESKSGNVQTGTVDAKFIRHMDEPFEKFDYKDAARRLTDQPGRIGPGNIGSRMQNQYEIDQYEGWKQVLAAAQREGDPVMESIAHSRLTAIGQSTESRIRMRTIVGRDIDRRMTQAEEDLAMRMMVRGAEDNAKYRVLVRGILTPEPVAEALTPVYKIAENSTGFWKGWDKLVGYLKVWQITSPGFHIRNWFGGVFNNALADVDWASYAQFMRLSKMDPAAMSEGQRTIWQNIIEHVPQGQTVGELGLGTGEAGVRLVGEDKPTRMLQFAKKNEAGQLRPAAGFLSPNSLLPRVSKRAGSDVEFYLRGTLMYDMMKKGRSIEEALAAVDKFHFNYSDVSQFDQKVKRLIPFYTWTRHNVPLQIEMMMMNPRVYARVQQAKQETERLSPADGIIPGYFPAAGAIRLPFMKGGGHKYFVPDMPFQDARFVTKPIEAITNTKGTFSQRLAQGIEEPLSLVTPWISGPLEMYFGKQVFNQLELRDDRPVRLKDLHMDWIAPFLGGNVHKADGDYFVTERDAYILEKFNPLWGRLRRLGLSNEPRMRENILNRSISFFLGTQIATNTSEQQQSAAYYNSRQAEMEKSWEKRIREMKQAG